MTSLLPVSFSLCLPRLFLTHHQKRNHLQVSRFFYDCQLSLSQFIYLYRNVTICSLRQFADGLNVPSLYPLMIPFLYPHNTALYVFSVGQFVALISLNGLLPAMLTFGLPAYFQSIIATLALSTVLSGRNVLSTTYPAMIFLLTAHWIAR